MNNYEEERIKSLTTLKEEYDSCTKCEKLCQTRTQPVFGIGNPSAQIIFIAEAPGMNEDKRNIPLIGDSGRVLDYLISCVSKDERLKQFSKSFRRGKNAFGKVIYEWPEHEAAKEVICENAFYTNVILCWPGKGNREPELNEIENCKKRLLETIYLIDPKVIISVGAHAAKTLLNKRSFTITKERGKTFEIVVPGIYTDIRYPVIPILHPSYLMRNADQDVPDGNWANTRGDLERAYMILEEVNKNE